MSAAKTIDAAMALLVPPTRMPLAEWLRERYYTSTGSGGRPFHERAVPWVTAPGGPCEAFDDPRFKRLWLQWAARMFKTTFGQAAQSYCADVDPCTMMFASVDEELVRQIFSRLWKQLDETPALRDQLPPSHLRNKTSVTFRHCEILGAWARGASRLADKAIRVGHANEIDKWEQASTATEGDPLPRFLKRGDEFADACFVLESTPSVKKRSRIEAGRLRSTNSSYQVPCPHCGRYQRLAFGDGKRAGGVFFAKRPDGGSDPELARTTAHYVCAYCEQSIDDRPRSEIVNRGVWVPEGCTVDDLRAETARTRPADSSYLRGEPLHNGQDWGSQISALYALHNGWGDVAYRFLIAKRRPTELRQVINEDFAETFEIGQREADWEKLGRRIVGRTNRGVIPAWASLLSCGCDRQKDHYVYAVQAWGPRERMATIDYGETATFAELRDQVLRNSWPHADGQSLTISFSLLDSGHRTAGIYEECLSAISAGVPVYPCKGSSRALDSEFLRTTLGPNTALPGMILYFVDTIRTQDWICERLLDGTCDAEDGYSLFSGPISDHEDFLRQITNDAAIEKLAADNYVRESWERIDAEVPNDFRDCLRYAYVARLIYAGRGDVPPRVAAPAATEADPPPPPPTFAVPLPPRSDGRPWSLPTR